MTETSTPPQSRWLSWVSGLLPLVTFLVGLFFGSHGIFGLRNDTARLEIERQKQAIEYRDLISDRLTKIALARQQPGSVGTDVVSIWIDDVIQFEARAAELEGRPPRQVYQSLRPMPPTGLTVR